MAIPDQILTGIGSLDPLPVTTQRLITLMGDEDASFAEIAALIEQDQAVSTTVLRVANSSLVRGKTQVGDVRSATIRLGHQMLLEIALGNYLKKGMFSAPLYELEENELWRHSSACAAAVREIAKHSPTGKLPTMAATAALVHDIGKLVMVRVLGGDVAQVRQLSDERQITFVEAERELFGFDHAEVGAELAQRWSFPRPIARAIELHHCSPVPYTEGEEGLILDTVVVANYVSKTIGIGLGAEGMNLDIDPECFKRLKLDVETFCSICSATVTQAMKLQEML